jgi:ketosteroid isomerase-like protein
MTPLKSRQIAASLALAALFGLGACASSQAAAPAARVAASADPVATTVMPFFDALAREDMAAAMALAARPDVTINAVFNPNGQTDDASIRTFPLSSYLGIVFRNYENVVFLDRRYSVADTGRTVWVEAEGDLRVAATGTPYRNRYVFKVELENGRISGLSEWVNTVTLTQQGIAARPAGQ